MAFKLGFQEKYILKLWCMLSSFKGVKVIVLLSKIFSAYNEIITIMPFCGFYLKATAINEAFTVNFVNIMLVAKCYVQKAIFFLRGWSRTQVICIWIVTRTRAWTGIFLKFSIWGLRNTFSTSFLGVIKWYFMKVLLKVWKEENIYSRKLEELIFWTWSIESL